MAKHKNCHFVSQFLLREFAVDEQRKQVSLLHIGRHRVITPVPIRNQASKDYFYEDPDVEEALAGMESMASGLIRTVLDTAQLPDTTSQEHTSLLAFVLLSCFRTKHSVDASSDVFDGHVKAMLAGHPAAGDGSLERVIFEYKDPAVSRLVFGSKSLHYAYDLKVKLLRNMTATGFVTSDNPVVLYNQFLESRARLGNITGLAAKGLQVFFPISPDFMLIYFDEAVYQVGGKEDRVVDINDDSDVLQLNTLQAANADQVFYFGKSVSTDEAVRVASRAREHRRDAKMKVEDWSVGPEDGCEPENVVLSYRTDVRSGLALSFVKLRPAASTYEPGDRLFHCRNAWYLGVCLAFSDRLKAGSCSPEEFPEFFADVRSGKIAIPELGQP